MTTKVSPVMGGGAWKLLSTQSASASSTLDWTSAHITSTYDTYAIVCTAVIVSLDGSQLQFRVSNDGGATYEADASDYAYTLSGIDDAGSAKNLISTSAGRMVFCNGHDTAVGGRAINGVVYMHHPSNSALYTHFSGVVQYSENANPGLATLTVSGEYNTAETVNGLQVMASSNQITSGKFSLYGLAI